MSKKHLRYGSQLRQQKNKRGPSRRLFLVGTGGITLALPVFQSMFSDKALAQSGIIPPRFVLAYAGMSTGGNRGEAVAPDTFGTTYELTDSVRSLAGGTIGGQTYNAVKDEFTVVSGLDIPYANESGKKARRVGNQGQWHHNDGTGPALTGKTHLDPGSNDPLIRAETADTIAARELQPGVDPLVFRVQAEAYRGSTASGYLSYYRANNGSLLRYDPQVSPFGIFNNIFGNFVSDTTSSDQVNLLRKTQMRKNSILDLLLESSNKLKRSMPKADIHRLDQHFEEFRKLEIATSEFEEQTSGGVCIKPTTPPEEFVKTNGSYDAKITVDGVVQTIKRDIGWTEEDKRAELIFDLTHMAMACGKSQVASVMMTHIQSFMASSFITRSQLGQDVHEAGHGSGKRENISDVYDWHLRYLARFVDKCRSTPEAGGTMLDNMIVVLVPEGGYYTKPDGGFSPHDAKNMVVVIGGRAGGIKHKGHIEMDGVHPAQIVLSALRAVGAHENGLGEFDPDEHVADLFS